MTTLQTAPHECDIHCGCRRLVDQLCERLIQAEALLHALHQAKSDSEQRLASDNRTDAMKAVTGRSSLDAAIESTRRLIDRLRHAINDTQSALASSQPMTRDTIARLRSVAFAG